MPICEHKETPVCNTCGRSDGQLKIGWTNAPYCSADCEINAVSRLHASMPGAGPSPRHGWVPYHILVEIRIRWEKI